MNILRFIVMTTLVCSSTKLLPLQAATVSPYFEREYRGVDRHSQDTKGRRFSQFPVSDAGIVPRSYTISATAGPGGNITPIGRILVDAGTDLAFAIVPDQFYNISDVIVDGASAGGISSYTFVNITSGHAIEAVFEQMPPEQATAAAGDVVADLPPGAFGNPNNQNATLNKLDGVIELIDSGDYQAALDKLRNDILKKTDGCATNGRPDKNDWVNDCDSQAQLYAAVMHLIEQLQGLL